MRASERARVIVRARLFFSIASHEIKSNNIVALANDGATGATRHCLSKEVNRPRDIFRFSRSRDTQSDCAFSRRRSRDNHGIDYANVEASRNNTRVH